MSVAGFNVNLSTLENLAATLEEAGKRSQVSVEELEKTLVQAKRISDEKIEAICECARRIKAYENAMRHIAALSSPYQVQLTIEDMSKLAERTAEQYERAKLWKGNFDKSVREFCLLVEDKNDEARKQFRASMYILQTLSYHLRLSQSVLTDGNAVNAQTSHNANSFNTGKQQLVRTQQKWNPASDGTSVFNSPVETGQILDPAQGKVAGFSGTCGLVSCANVLRLAGSNATEEQMIDFASTYGLCYGNGGTTPSGRQAVLSHYGISSSLQYANVDNIANAVSEGRGVIASVDAGLLWEDPDYLGALHAITVTSVKKDGAGNTIGFFICDSGTGGRDSAKFYTVSHLSSALSGKPLNVTSVIR